MMRRVLLILVILLISASAGCFGKSSTTLPPITPTVIHETPVQTTPVQTTPLSGITPIPFTIPPTVVMDNQTVWNTTTGRYDIVWTVLNTTTRMNETLIVGSHV